MIMQGCQGQGNIIASYQLEVSCPLDFTYYPFDRQVKILQYYHSAHPTEITFKTCELEFSLPDNGLEDVSVEKLVLMWKDDPKIITNPALHDGLMNDWDRSAKFYNGGDDCVRCEKDKLRMHFILTVRFDCYFLRTYHKFINSN